MPKNPKRGHLGSIKRFLQTENFKKCNGVIFDEIRNFLKKSRIAPKKPKGGTLCSHLYFWKHEKITV